MIIVEGPDGAGKTNLIARLKQDLQFEVMPRSSSSEHGIDMRSLRQWVDDDLSRPVHGPRVHDRYPLISEPIYGPLTRGRMADGFEDLEWMSRSLQSLYTIEPLIIYCLPPQDAVRHNVQATHGMTTEHMRAVNRQISALWHAYCHRAALDIASNNTAIVWNYAQAESDRLYLDIVEICGGYL